MEELVKHLQSIAVEVDGVEMVPLSVAIQSVQTSNAIQIVDSLEKMLADLNQIYTDESFKNIEE